MKVWTYKIVIFIQFEEMIITITLMDTRNTCLHQFLMISSQLIEYILLVQQGYSYVWESSYKQPFLLKWNAQLLGEKKTSYFLENLRLKKMYTRFLNTAAGRVI